MAYIEAGDERIEPATPADLERLFEESRILGVSVHQDRKHAVQATVTGGSALVLYVDHQHGSAEMPEGRVDREESLAILKTYLETGTLHPDYNWTNAALPTVSTGGCRNAAAVLLTCAALGSLAACLLMIRAM